MDAVLRLRYLKAMGIPQFVARMPLPGAHPSTLLALDVPDEYLPPTAAPDATPTPVSISPKQPEISAPAPPQRVNTKQREEVFNYQAAIWQTGDILIIADMPVFDNRTLSLLNDILKSIQRDQANSPDAFQWPMPNGMGGDTFSAARDYLQGYLEGGILRRHTIQQILTFGQTACMLLSEGDSARFGDWPLVRLPAISNMMSNPNEKSAAWKTLSTLSKTKA
jgi:hypothetical protein